MDASIPWVSFALFVMILITALTAFAPQMVPPGSRITSIRSILIDISSANGREHPMGVFRTLRDDIDHRVDGVCSPDGSAGSANHFDPIDIREQCVLHLPINSCKQRRVNGSTVEEYQHGSGKAASESAHADGPFVGIDSGNLHPRHEAEDLWDTGRPGQANVLLCKDVNRRWSSRNRHRFFRYGRDLEVPELSQA